MKPKKNVEGSGVTSTEIELTLRKVNHKRKRLNFRQGMIMKVILGPPRAKERLFRGYRLP